MGGKGQILVMMGELSNQAARQRTQDIHDVIATPDCSGISIIEEQTGNWSRTQGTDLMTNWISAGHQFDAVVSNNDEMAIGAIQALKASGVRHGQGHRRRHRRDAGRARGMKAGDLDVTVFQNAAGQGQGAVDTALKLANGETGRELRLGPVRAGDPGQHGRVRWPRTDAGQGRWAGRQAAPGDRVAATTGRISAWRASTTARARSRGRARRGDLLAVEGIRKAFPGVVALDNVQFRLRPGTVHALMGENGAGKSTLMKIIAGIYHPDAGTIRLRGQEVRLASPLDALEKRHRHDPSGAQPDAVHDGGREHLDPARAQERASASSITAPCGARPRSCSSALNIKIDPEHRGARAHRRQPADGRDRQGRVLRIRHPDHGRADLGPDRDARSTHLFEIIRDLRAQGKGIVYITHKMNELFEISDEFSVFRDGKYVGTHAAKDVTRDDIIRMMVGREITQMFPKEEVPIGEVVLKVENLTLDGVFHDVSFELRAGEILGMAGLVGSGRSNVAETIFGVTPATSGQISIRGQPVDDRFARAPPCATAWRS